MSRRATLEAATKLGLTPEEYAHICEIQEGEPTYVELAIYSLMWSEHCSYKHSRPILGRFPTSGPRVLQGPGENAGIIDVGDGWAVAIKIESHNHPSAVEPFQGAATGVGGIVRDIFTMGARPCVCLDSLRFGELTEPRQRFLLDGVVGRYRPLRQLPRHPHGRRRDLLRVQLRGQLPRQRDGGRHDPHRRHRPGDRQRRRQPRGADRLQDRPRRHRRRQRPGEPGVRRDARREAPERPGRRPVHREEAHRGLPRAHPSQARGEHAGPRRRRPHKFEQRDGQQGAGGPRHPRRPRAAARGRHGALGDHDQREPGAHAGDRHGRTAPGGARRLRPLGPRLHRHRRGHRQQDAAHLLARRACGGHPRAAPRRREPGDPHACSEAGVHRR